MKKRDKKSLADRLKEARIKAGISQRKLGIAAGIDSFVASTRINRYEKGVHEPDYGTSERLAKALNIPLAYLYSEGDDLADIVEAYGKLTATKKRQLLIYALSLSSEESQDSSKGD